MPRFSVIIPTYNRAALLREALESVFAQTFTDFEVIVVDDGSADDTPAVLASYGARVRFYRQENRGPGAARNLGIQHAAGEYVAFLDSDDVWFPWTLEIYRQSIRESNGASIIAGKLFEFSNRAQLTEPSRVALQAEFFVDYFSSSHRHYFIGAGMAVLHRQTVLRAGGFTKWRINCEDIDLVMRLGTVPGFVQIQAPCTIAWRRHPGSTTMVWTKNFRGICHVLQQERNGCYSGGHPFCSRRWCILTAYTRSISIGCLRMGQFRNAWLLYRISLPYHLKTFRWKYFVGFSWCAIKAHVHFWNVRGNQNCKANSDTTFMQKPVYCIKKWLWSWRMLLTRSRVTGRLVNYGLRGLSWTMRCNPFQRLKQSVRCATYLNIGCGKRPDPAFTNLDLSWFPGVQLVWNLERPLPFKESSLAGIYTEHCFEHLPQPFVADVLLKELHRCLRPNGIVRIIVPDGELFVELYHSSRSNRNVSFPSPGSFSEDLPTPMMHVNRIFRSWDHLFAYDFETLAYMLGRAGFVDIKSCAYREGTDQNLLIDSPERREESLRIEARASKAMPT